MGETTKEFVAVVPISPTPHEVVYICHKVASFKTPVQLNVELPLGQIVAGEAVATGTSGFVQLAPTASSVIYRAEFTALLLQPARLTCNL